METGRERINGDRLTFISSVIAFALILYFPAVAGAGMRAGLTLCARAVIPSVFPSLILTDLLFSRPTEVIEGTLGRLFARFFRVSPRGAVGWIAGLLCGFPVGAITVASDVRQGLISREEEQPEADATAESGQESPQDEEAGPPEKKPDFRRKMKFWK